MTETERKFLVEKLPENINRFPHSDITQGYLAIEESGGEVRVRQKGDRFYLTVKSGGGLTRAEYEVELTPEQYYGLLPASAERIVKKTRYEIPHNQYTIELDIYKERCNGLITAEIEFTDEEASGNFSPPEWFGREITDDKQYKNQNLALFGLSE